MSQINIEDIEFISKKPRVRNKIIIDDWNKTLKFEHNNLIHTFEGFDDKKWIAKLTSHGEDIIKTYEEYKTQNKNINNIEEFFNTNNKL